MSAEIDDGGPAFPVPPPIAETDGVSMQWSYANPGMSLRDWFAGMALMGFASESGRYDSGGAAADAYAWADAMLAARKRTD